MKKPTSLTASVTAVALAASLAASPVALAWADDELAAPAAEGTVEVTEPAIETDADTLRAEWTVTFTGSGMQDDYSEVVQTISGMQPGDIAEFTINLVNAYDGEVDWYVRNRIQDSMEDNGRTGNSGGAYQYELIDINGDERNVLYSNARVGGDAAGIATASVVDATEGEATSGGLNNVTENSGMADYFFLATMPANSTRQMKLVMGIDGETHTNGYFDSNAGALLQYAAEPVARESIVEQVPGETTVVENKESTVRTVYTTTEVNENLVRTGASTLSQTGDSLSLTTILLMAVGFIMLCIGVYSWYHDGVKGRLAVATEAPEATEKAKGSDAE